MYKIGVLTYNIRHRKTYDTLCLLKAKGYTDVTVFAQPLHYKKTFHPLIEHRPILNMEIPEPKILCNNFQYTYIEQDIEKLQVPPAMTLLVCGAGIIPDEIVKQNIIINAHPGYIPEARGLDALKWAIYEKKKIGVTSHIIGKYVDAGEIIERREVRIFKYDTFHSLAQRVYETEIDMLVEAIGKLEEPHNFIEPGENVLHKRMPHEKEIELLEKFEEYKKLYCEK